MTGSIKWTIHNSENSETAVQWCSLKYDHVLKSHPNVKVHRRLWYKKLPICTYKLLEF